MAYNGTIDVISGFRAKNNGTFPLVDAKDVFVADGKRLDVAIEEFEEMNSQQNQQIEGLKENTSATNGLLDRVNARVTAIENTKVVKTVNGTEPDENGDVAVEVGSDITVDDTLTIEGAAADAKAVSDALSTLLQSVSASYGDLRSDLTTLDESVVKTVNGVAPDDAGNVVVEGGGSGGVSSWNDLTDKPFYDNSGTRTYFDNASMTSELTTLFGVTAYATTNIVTEEVVNIFNKEGVQTTFIVDGTTYNCTSKNVESGAVSGFAYGNTDALLGIGNTGEPFVMLPVWIESGGVTTYTLIIVFIQDTAATEHTVSLSAFVEDLKKLDAKYHDGTYIRTIVEEVISEALEGDY